MARQEYSSYDPTLSETSPSQTTDTIHHRRTLSRNTPETPARVPPSLQGFTELFKARVSTPLVTPVPSDKADATGAQRWQRMLGMQREFHCYRSARLEAAVEAVERGEAPPIRESPHTMERRGET